MSFVCRSFGFEAFLDEGGGTEGLVILLLRPPNARVDWGVERDLLPLDDPSGRPRRPGGIIAGLGIVDDV